MMYALIVAAAIGMTPVQQTEMGPTGNCLSACVASILEVPLSEVPNFNRRPDGILPEPYVELWVWLRKRGYKLREVGEPPSGYAIRIGRCRDGLHSHVVLDGKQVHEPSPTPVSVTGPYVYWAWTAN